ncbi:MAG: hypothetical protein IJG87_06430 [Ruminococcus sp.]|nr:hypothetical protein [Ruminococcus sp.]
MYIVVETQTNGNTTTVVTPATYADRNAAESKFHTVLAAAAVSNVEKHACIVFTEEGFPVMHECYVHEANA